MPAIRTMKATSVDRAATIGAMTPPSLWPIRPIACRVDLAPRLEEGDAGQDVAGEVVAGEFIVSPVEPPTPRSSTRSTAIPRRVSASARTRNGLCSKIVSSRSWAPEPLIRITAGNGPPFGLGERPGQRDAAGLVQVSDLDRLVGKRTPSASAAGGLSGLVRLLQVSAAFCRPAWVHVPTASVPSALSLPLYLPPIAFISKASVVLSSVTVSTFRPLAPWSGLSILAMSLPSAVLPMCTTIRRLNPAPTSNFPSQTCSGPAIFGMGVGVFVRLKVRGSWTPRCDQVPVASVASALRVPLYRAAVAFRSNDSASRGVRVRTGQA